jgi:hypothetical protein
MAPPYYSLCCIFVVYLVIHIATANSASSRKENVPTFRTIPIGRRRSWMTSGMQHSPKANTTLALLVIILSNDIQVNPGPNKSIYPCGLCDVSVTWNCEGVGCDGCSIWYHKSCVELCSRTIAYLTDLTCSGCAAAVIV